MNKKLIALLLSTAAASVMISSSASAVEPCKFYFKAYGGYSIANKPTVEKTVKPFLPVAEPAQGRSIIADKTGKNLTGGTFGGGFGYNMSDAFRSDITVDFTTVKERYSDKDTKADATTGLLRFQQESLKVLANLYFDFNNNSAFTPYVTGGIGLENLKGQVNLVKFGDAEKTTDEKNPSGYRNFYAAKADGSIEAKEIKEVKTDKRINKFAWQVGAGVAYKATDNMYIDVSYKLSSLADTKGYPAFYSSGKYFSTAATGGGVKSFSDKFSDLKNKSSLQHSFLVGLRVQF